MFSYSSFLLEKKLELISESILYFSPRLRKLLKVMDDDISKDLLNSEHTNIEDDITLIDLDKSAGYINFTTSVNALKNLAIKYPDNKFGSFFEKEPSKSIMDDLFNLENEVWSKSRTPLKIGRLIQKIFPNKYNSSQIEKFTNTFKSLIENAEEKIIIVEGKDIGYWYDSANYMKEQSSLGGSCMRNKPVYYFNLYKDNPEICRLVCIVQKSPDDFKLKLKARALIWKIDTIFTGLPKVTEDEFQYFMDRQYAIDDSYIIKLKNWAEENGMAYRANNNASDFRKYIYKGNPYISSLSVKLKEENRGKDYSTYPYMDTFKRFDVRNGILWNDTEEAGHEGQYLLENVDGGYEIIEDNTVWSEWAGKSIHSDDAVYSEIYDDYLPSNRAVEVTTGSRNNRGWYPEGDENLVWDGWSEEYINVDDSVFSDEYGYSIYEENARNVVITIDKETGDCDQDSYYLHKRDTDFVKFNNLYPYFWFQKLRNKYNNWRLKEGILKKLLDKDSSEDYILKDFKIEVYRVKGATNIKSDKNIEWLTKLDSQLLDVEIDEKNHKFDELWGYVDELNQCGVIQRMKNIIRDLKKSQQLEMEFGDELSENRIKKIERRIDYLNRFL